MQTLAKLFVQAKLTAHFAHHFASGSSFFADHEELGELYGAYDDSFDRVAEEAIGTGAAFDEVTAVRTAAQAFDGGTFDKLVALENSIQARIDAILKLGKSKTSTDNLLQDLATESSKRLYKLGQRVGETSEMRKRGQG